MNLDKQQARDLLKKANDPGYPFSNDEMIGVVLLCGAALDRIDELEGKPRSGLYGKYIIQKADGSVVDPHADYFVLRLDTDPVARRATLEYSYMTPDRDLAKNLQDRLELHDPKMGDISALNYYGITRSDLVEKCDGQAKRIAELEALTPEHPDFAVDMKKIERGEEVSAKKWITAYRKAQNSNVVRQQMLDFHQKTVDDQAKRIEELELHNARLTDALIEARTKLQAKGLL